MLAGIGAVLGPLGISLDALFGGKTKKGGAELAATFRTIGKVAAIVVLVFALGVAALVATFAVAAALFATVFIGPIVLAMAILWLTWKSFTAIVKGAPAVGRAIADGLVAGIRAGVSAVGEAAAGLARAGIGAVRDTLVIRSPSRVMMGLGRYTAEGFARGVDGGREGASRSMGDLVEPPSGRRLASMGGGGINLTVIVQRGDGDPEDIGERAARAAAELLTDWMEGTALAGT
jgi:hypothetical protein